MRRRWMWVWSLGVFSACSSNGADPPKPPPVSATLGGASVRLEIDPLRIVIANAAGKVVFDGLAPAPVPAQTEDADPPPLTGLAVRDVETKVQALYGSYQFTDTGTTWRVATRASNVKTDAAGLAFDAVGDAGKVATVTIRAEKDGELAIAVTPASTAPAGARTWTTLGARCAADEHFLGFGAQARDVDHRGTVVPVFVSEPGIGKRDDDEPVPIWYISGTRHASSWPAPLYLASRGYVGALDTPGRATFGMCAEQDVLRVSGDSDAAKDRTFVFRLFLGDTPKQALAKSTAFFGRPRVPPRLAFAPWNDAILGSAKVRDLAKYLRDKDVPSSAIWYEDWRGGVFQGDDYKLAEEWDADPVLYPEIDKLAADLHAQGFASFVYFNTFVQKGLKIWDETAPAGHLVKKADGSIYEFSNVKQKPAGMIDLTSTAAKTFTTDKLKAALALGIDGWMGDYGEWLPLDAKLADGSDPWATHNLYPQLWQEAQRAALDADGLGDKASPKERRLTFVRSGLLRNAPLADVVWAGDQATDLSEDDGLPTVVPMGLGLSILGVSTYGSDVAGYQTALRKPTDRETFFRWVELGAWSPVMRTHHGTQPLKMWVLQTDEASTQHWRSYAILHQQLTPYFELLAKEARDTGTTIWRHLAVEFPEQPETWKVHDQFMVGPSILVAPVTKAGSVERSVWLPAGKWVPWAGGAALEGGRRVGVAATLEQIPAFVRAGSVVPMFPNTVRTVLAEAKGLVRDVDVADDRDLLVVAGGAASVVEAGGLSYELTAGDAAGPSWNGVALPACAATPVAPCAQTSPGGAVAYVTGPGTLRAAGAALAVAGGKGDRRLRIDVRSP
jgi:alpha-glucosidase (family GH31 glycosyl hydrolase)